MSGALRFEVCEKAHAVECVRAWHSRLPNCQSGPWMYAFRGALPSGETCAVALWNNPSARTLPKDWIELRRMAISPQAPPNTASQFLGWMVRWLRRNAPRHTRAISYQDTAVHTGTIYRASGWTPGFVTKARVRDRSPMRRGYERQYRKDINGMAAASSEKIRWEKELTPLAPRHRAAAAAPGGGPSGCAPHVEVSA